MLAEKADPMENLQVIALLAFILQGREAVQDTKQDMVLEEEAETVIVEALARAFKICIMVTTTKLTVTSVFQGAATAPQTEKVGATDYIWIFALGMGHPAVELVLLLAARPVTQK